MAVLPTDEHPAPFLSNTHFYIGGSTILSKRNWKQFKLLWVPNPGQCDIITSWPKRKVAIMKTVWMIKYCILSQQ